MLGSASESQHLQCPAKDKLPEQEDRARTELGVPLVETSRNSLRMLLQPPERTVLSCSLLVSI